MKKSVLRRGFTLIELLVVIAIIGVLSTIVLGSVNTARNKGSDTAIKANLSNIRTAAELYYDTNGNYGSVSHAVGACAATASTLFADAAVSGAITAAGNASVTGGGIGQGSCVSNGSAWAVSVPLKSASANSWCVDSTGASKQVTPAGTDRGFSSVACK